MGKKAIIVVGAGDATVGAIAAVTRRHLIETFLRNDPRLNFLSAAFSRRLWKHVSTHGGVPTVSYTHLTLPTKA